MPFISEDELKKLQQKEYDEGKKHGETVGSSELRHFIYIVTSDLDKKTNKELQELENQINAIPKDNSYGLGYPFMDKPGPGIIFSFVHTILSELAKENEKREYIKRAVAP